MISVGESKIIQAINNETKRELGNVLYTKWLLIMNSKNLDSKIIGVCCLYCENIYSKLYGLTITSVHDSFISLASDKLYI